MRSAPGVLSLLIAATLYAPCTASGNEASPADSGMPGTPAGAMTAAEGAAICAGMPEPDLFPDDVFEEFSTPAPRDQRLTLEERLSLQNAICALWANSMKQEPAPVESIDLMDADAPDHVFLEPLSAFYYDKGEWVFEGLLRQMAPDSSGIECIGGIQSFRASFRKEAAGRFTLLSFFFDDLGKG